MEKENLGDGWERESVLIQRNEKRKYFRFRRKKGGKAESILIRKKNRGSLLIQRRKKKKVFEFKRKRYFDSKTKRRKYYN